MFPGGSLQVTCEVCETPQAPATVCAECGMPLRLPRGVRPIADPPIERLADLEATQFEAAPEVGMAPPPGLELTLMEPAPEVQPDFLPNFESTSDQALLDLPGDDPVLPGIERTTEEFERSPAPPAGLPSNCPYCGFVQASGRLCNNCGRSRIRVLPTGEGPVARYDEEATVRCRSCGALVKHYKLCSDCGMPLPQTEE